MSGTSMEGLPRIVWEPIIRAALAEDLGRAGDITSEAVVPAATQTSATIVARRGGRIAGLDLALEVFRTVDSSIAASALVNDGQDIEAGAALATLEGPARLILTAERTALNFLGHLSGVASETAAVCRAIDGLKTRVTCTRKTTPGLRALEKYAVR